MSIQELKNPGAAASAHFKSSVREDSTPQTSASRLLIVLAFAAVYLIWGSTYLGIKYAIQPDIEGLSLSYGVITVDYPSLRIYGYSASSASSLG